VSDAWAIVTWSLLVFLTGTGIVLVSSLLGPRRTHTAKQGPYECGVPLFQDARNRFPVRFYLMAIVFILFDIEIVFLLPWAMLFRELGIAGLVDVLLFIAVLGAGYVYIWKKGVIDWK
jgi:NADH-quinone oxidoreductase subunit A